MAEWKTRAQILEDVVYFRYLPSHSVGKSANGSVSTSTINSSIAGSFPIEKNFKEVFVWDLDKTYLDTHFGSLKEVWRTALEKAFQKRNVPGTASLVLAMKNAWQEERLQEPFPIYFITASPPQMEDRIREKLELDDILPLGCFYKDNLRNLRPKRLWRLTNQIGFKLQSLLQLRVQLGEDVRQILWGDDSESDAIIYSLYSDICARRWREKDLLAILRDLHVVGEQTETILELQDSIPVMDPVEKIYINLATDTDPDYYLKFGRRMIPTYNTFQVALDLFQDKRLREEQVIHVAQDMVMNYGYTTDMLESSLDNVVRRQLLSDLAFAKIDPVLKENKLISNEFKPSIEPSKIKSQIGDRIYSLEGVHEPWVPEHIDYLRENR